MNQAYIQALRREPITPPQTDLNALGSVIPHAVMANLLQDLESKQRALNQAEALLLKAQSENEELAKVVKALQAYAEQLTQELQKKEEELSFSREKLVSTAEVLTAIAEPIQEEEPPLPAVFRRRRT
jgi:peptidoglycan hydrolase CwlO-like protein